jgi:hypothetical protein
MDSNYLLGYVCDPVAKRLAIDVLAGHGRTVGGDADGIGQGRAFGNLEIVGGVVGRRCTGMIWSISRQTGELWGIGGNFPTKGKYLILLFR